LVFYLQIYFTLIGLTPLLLFLTLFPYSVLFNSFQCVLFNINHSLSFFSSFHPALASSPLTVPLLETHLCMCVCVCTCVCMCVYTCMCVCACVHVCAVCAHVCAYVCVCAHVCAVCMCMHVHVMCDNTCACIWIYLPYTRENSQLFSLPSWLASLNMMISISIHLYENNTISFLFMAQ
jgi:hypothetical protein